MLLYENKNAILLDLLKTDINPFKKFVSTGEIKEDLGLVNSRNSLLESITEIIENKENFILPIIGKVGTGKTHLFWALRNKLYYYNTIYISLDKVYKKFFYNTYSEFIETIGMEPLRNIVNHLCNTWGALEKKFGFFHVADIDKVKNAAFEKLIGDYKEDERVALIDVINGITTHQLDPYNKIEAEGWLLGELMNIRELTRLNLMHDLRKNKNAFIMLKLLIENSKLGTVLFLDDFERVINIPILEEDDDDEVFDSSWRYGRKKSPDDMLSQKIFNNILKLQRINGLRIIITLRSLDSLEKIKRDMSDIDQELPFTILDPQFLQNFTGKDILEFYIKNLNLYLESFQYANFLEEFPELYFPLNEKALININNYTKGNPREITKLLIKLFNEIMTSQNDLEKILNRYENLK